MIFDRLENFPLYLAVHPHFADAWAFLQQHDPDALAAGRYEINEGGAFVLVSEYDTRPGADCFIEAHRKYIDIQLLTRGAEGVGICCRHDARELPYDEEKDFLKLEGPCDQITLQAGRFAVFFPDDGHMPTMQLGAGAATVKKLVFKIPVATA